MKKLIAGILIFFIIIILGIIGYLYIVGATGEPWIENGEFRHSLVAFYDDGTSGEITLTKPLFDISYGDKNIETIEYILEGMVDGDPLHINLSEYSIVFSVYSMDGLIVNNVSLSPDIGFVDTVDGEYVVLMDKSFDSSVLFNENDVDGEYYIRMTPTGKINYYYNDQWKPSNLPSVLEFNVKLINTGNGGGDPDIVLIFKTSTNYYSN